jgi:hypothetical protein
MFLAKYLLSFSTKRRKEYMGKKNAERLFPKTPGGLPARTQSQGIGYRAPTSSPQPEKAA